MDIRATGALSSYAYQSSLAQTGSADRALIQALTMGQSQAADAGALVASAGLVDPLSALAGGSNSQALTTLAYGASEALGNGPQALRAMLASLGGGGSAFAPSSDGLPVSAAAISPGATQALLRYAYDQSQDPEGAAKQAALSAQQSLLSSGLNLLA